MSDEEIYKRLIMPDEITFKAQKEIENGFKGKAVVAFIDLLGFSQKIIQNWDSKEDDPLLTLMEIKSFLEIVKEKIKTIILLDYDDRTIIVEVEYPQIVTVSDSFMLLLPIDDSNEQTILASIFSVLTTCLEIWKASVDRGFTIRGGIEYGDIYYNKLDIVGTAFITAYHLESQVASNSRVIFSQNIKQLINQNLKNVHPTIIHYLLRFIYKDIDGFIAINPAMVFAQDIAITTDSLQKLGSITSKIKEPKILAKYDDLIDKIKKRDLKMKDISIFD